MAVPLLIKTSQETAISNDISSERLINCFLTERKENQVTKQAIIGDHGYDILGTATSGSVVRGAIATEDGTKGYIVIDNTLYSVDSGGTRTTIHTLTTSSGKVSMIIGATYMMLVDGTNGYTVKLSDDSYTQISDPNFVTNPAVVTYLDGYFATIGQISGLYWLVLSDINDPTSWPIINQIEPDGLGTLISVVSFNRELWVMSTTHSIVYTDQPLSGTVVEFPLTMSYKYDYGISSAFGVAVINNSAYWIARTRKSKAILVKASGATVEKVDNEDMNRLFQSFSTVSDSFAYSFEDGGDEFILISFPTLDQTWMYYPRTNTFSQKIGSDGHYFIGNCYLFLNNKHTVGSRSSGRLYTLSLTSYAEDGGSAIPRTIILPTLYDNYNWVSLPLVRAVVDSSSFTAAQTWSFAVSTDGGDNYHTTLTSSVALNTDYAQYTRISAGRRITGKLTFNAKYKFILVNIMAYVKSRGRS